MISMIELIAVTGMFILALCIVEKRLLWVLFIMFALFSVFRSFRIF